MNSFVEAVDPQTVLVIAAIAVALLLSTLLIRILKASVGLILTILAIVLVLQYLFGISPDQLWSEIANLPQAVTQLVKSFDLNALSSVFSG